jgi:hypothetical protein
MEIGTDTTIPTLALHPEMRPSPEGHTYYFINESGARCVGRGWRRNYLERRSMQTDFKKLLVKRRKIGVKG